jgi:hypothetical protein
MKFRDPCHITCPHCGALSDQRVARMLTLEAICPQCQGSLITAGLDMRQSLDAWSSYILPVLLVLDLENRLGSKIADVEALGHVKTLCDLVVMVERHLPPGDTVTAQAIGMVKSAVEQIRRECSIRNCDGCEDTLNFDIPLLEAIDPRRWDRCVSA